MCVKRNRTKGKCSKCTISWTDSDQSKGTTGVKTSLLTGKTFIFMFTCFHEFLSQLFIYITVTSFISFPINWCSVILTSAVLLFHGYFTFPCSSFLSHSSLNGFYIAFISRCVWPHSMIWSFCSSGHLFRHFFTLLLFSPVSSITFYDDRQTLSEVHKSIFVISKC